MEHSTTDSEEVEAPSPLLLSDNEKRVLELYDKLQQLQLEVALLTAQKNYVPGMFFVLYTEQLSELHYWC
jgi:hypothetical protein